jgi:hypothetical protein
MRVRGGVEPWSFISSTYTDSQGLYTLRGVPDGSIVIVVSGQGYVEQRKTIKVADGQDVNGVDF